MHYNIVSFGDAHVSKMIREEVFMKEQGFKNEFDEIDPKAMHIELYEEEPLGCARIYKKDEHTYIVGRIAILPQYRGNHYGYEIMSIIENQCKLLGADRIELSAQVRVSSFYEKMGYKKTGEEYLDEYCPHIRMYKEI